MSPKRPVLKYYGSKWRLAKWIISFFPPHRVYCEPFCGGASVLLRKPRSKGEIINDLNSDIVNLFKVLRDPESAQKLKSMVELTPFSREEFRNAYLQSNDQVERARRLLVRSFMGYANTGNTSRETGFRVKTYNRSYTTQPTDWATWPQQIKCFTERLQGVLIEHLDALACIATHDSPDTLFFVDPPYLLETRHSSCRGYLHEMAEEDHIALLKKLKSVKGMVVISGYQSDLYDKLLSGWGKAEKKALTLSGSYKTEILYLSPSLMAERFPLLTCRTRCKETLNVYRML